MLCGGSLGVTIFDIICKVKKIKKPTLDWKGKIVGIVAGSFLGAFAGLMIGLISNGLQDFPINYYITIAGSCLFTVGALNNIQDEIQG